jgi:hypothetical protein
MPARVTDKLLKKLRETAAEQGGAVTITLPDGSSIRIEPPGAIVPQPRGNTCDGAFG